MGGKDKCDCCETACVCRLKVERSVKIGRDLQVRGDADVDGDLTVDGNIVANGQVLPHRFVLLTKTVEQPVLNNTEVPVVWNIASSNGLAFTTAGSDFVAVQAGLYSFTAQLVFGPPNVPVGARTVSFTVNDVAIATVNNVPSNGTLNTIAGASAVWYLNVGDRVQCRADQTSGVPLLNVLGTDSATKWMITQLR